MGLLKVHAGDFVAGYSGNTGHFDGFFFWLYPRADPSNQGKIPAAELDRVEAVHEESVKRIGGAIGAGLLFALCLSILAGLAAWGIIASTSASLADWSYAAEQRAAAEVWIWAVAAGCAPFGFLAGVILGGVGKDVTFAATFKDGRRLLATTNSETYTQLLAVAFK